MKDDELEQIIEDFKSKLTDKYETLENQLDSDFREKKEENSKKLSDLSKKLEDIQKRVSNEQTRLDEFPAKYQKAFVDVLEKDENRKLINSLMEETTNKLKQVSDSFSNNLVKLDSKINQSIKSSKRSNSWSKVYSALFFFISIVSAFYFFVISGNVTSKIQSATDNISSLLVLSTHSEVAREKVRSARQQLKLSNIAPQYNHPDSIFSIEISYKMRLGFQVENYWIAQKAYQELTNSLQLIPIENFAKWDLELKIMLDSIKVELDKKDEQNIIQDAPLYFKNFASLQDKQELDFKNFRIREGEYLISDIIQRLETISSLIDKRRRDVSNSKIRSFIAE